jgi:hypothetical protein
VPRDRRWDHLYDRRAQPVRAFVVERFGMELGEELARREPRPPDAVVRLALELARLDLAREWEALERRLDEERARVGDDAAAAARTLGRELVETCLDFKEWAEGARLGRADLAASLRHAEAALFRVVVPG